MSVENRSGFIKRNVDFIRWKYDTNVFQNDRNVCISDIFKKCKLDDNEYQCIDQLKELLYARDNHGTIQGFSTEELQDFINYISTS